MAAPISVAQGGEGVRPWILGDRMSSTAIEVLLFDLGGVLVHWDGVESLRALPGIRLTREQARKFWLDSPSVRRFETGESMPEEFAAEAVAELGLAVPPRDFLDHFAGWDRGLFPGALELLEELRPRFRLACLSNNNSLAWPRLRDEHGLSQVFERCYLSHEIGAAKPDREIFEFVLRDLKCSGHRILFFDDNPECVVSARAAGLQADIAVGPMGVRRALIRRHLLSGLER
jgi:HAD superfamily hydrolase (TIGR01509 family)